MKKKASFAECIDPITVRGYKFNHLAINSTIAVAGKAGFTQASAATAVVEFMVRWSNLGPLTVPGCLLCSAFEWHCHSCPHLCIFVITTAAGLPGVRCGSPSGAPGDSCRSSPASASPTRGTSGLVDQARRPWLSNSRYIQLRTFLLNTSHCKLKS